MRFSLISAIATLGSVVMAQPVTQLAARKVTSQETVDVLDDLAKKAHDLEERVKKIDPLTAPIEYPEIITGYQDIILIANGFVKKDQESDNGNAFSDEECLEVSKTYHTFARSNQVPLYILADKADIQTSRPFHAPMETVLGSLETAYYQLVSDVVNHCSQGIPKKEIEGDQFRLGSAVFQAKKAYHDYL